MTVLGYYKPDLSTTMMRRMPFRIHTPANVTPTRLLCSIVQKPSVAKNKLDTTPTMTPASTSTRSLCFPVVTSKLASRSSTSEEANEAMVEWNSRLSRARVNRWTWMLGNVA